MVTEKTATAYIGYVQRLRAMVRVDNLLWQRQN